MNTMPVYRQGRRVYHDSVQRKPRCVYLMLGLTMLAASVALLWTEVVYRNMIESFNEIKDEIVPVQQATNGHVVFFQSSEIDASSSDLDFGVSLKGALQIRRNTEYCQWTESSITRRDENNRTYTDYSYLKTWRSHRINSLVFDQPAAHHNPQRDPYHSQTFPSRDAVADVQGTGKVALDPSLLSKTYSPWRYVDWTLGAVPKQSWFSQWWPWPDTTRYESIARLEDTHMSQAGRSHNFVYVGQGGYFFSPYESTNFKTMVNYFLQYLEGSLFDWQLGDLMPGCTAGDIRVRYSVQDPSEISVLGGLSAGKAAAAEHHIALHRTPKGHEVGILHDGLQTPEVMMSTEAHRQKWWCVGARALFLVPSAMVSSYAAEKAMLDFKVMVVGIWALTVGLLWLVLWGANPFALGSIALACASLGYAYKNPVQGVKVGETGK